MGKSKTKKGPPPEECLILPKHPARESTLPFEIIDTHTHVLSTYAAYAAKYPPPESKHATVKSFVKDVLLAQGVTSVVDVWCEAPVTPNWEEVVDSLTDLGVDGFSYNFVIGAHPHEAKNYDEATEAAIEMAHRHPRCVGWGEIGLDYHYDNSPREEQQGVLRKQLRSALASGLNKAITIHTREADEDIYRILTEELPATQKLHIHCFTDSPELATKLLDHFPNLFIGITGVVTYSTNLNTANVIRDLGAKCDPPKSPSEYKNHPLRLLGESDAPYMIPGNMPPGSELGMKSGQKMPFSHSGMIPWTADFVTKVLNEGREEQDSWKTEDVLMIMRENARTCYGV